MAGENNQYMLGADIVDQEPSSDNGSLGDSNDGTVKETKKTSSFFGGLMSSFYDKLVSPNASKEDGKDEKQKIEDFKNEIQSEASQIYKYLKINVEPADIDSAIKREIINRIAANALSFEGFIDENDVKKTALYNTYTAYIDQEMDKVEAVRKSVILAIFKDLYLQEIIKKNSKPGQTYSPNLQDIEKINSLSNKELLKIINKNSDSIKASNFKSEIKNEGDYPRDKTEVKDESSIYFAINKYKNASSLDWTFHSFDAINKKNQNNLIKAIKLASNHGLEITPMIERGGVKEVLNPCNLNYETVEALASAHEYVKNKKKASMLDDNSDENIRKDIVNIYAMGLLSYAIKDMDVFYQKIDSLKGKVDDSIFSQILTRVQDHENFNDDDLLSVYSKSLSKKNGTQKINIDASRLSQKYSSNNQETSKKEPEKYFLNFIARKVETEEKVENNTKVIVGKLVNIQESEKIKKIECQTLSGGGIGLGNPKTEQESMTVQNEDKNEFKL